MAGLVSDKVFRIMIAISGFGFNKILLNDILCFERGSNFKLST